MKNSLYAVAAIFTVAIFAAQALAQEQNPPKKANRLIVNLVEGVAACTAATTTTGGVIDLAACDTEPADTVCQFRTNPRNGKLMGLGMVKAIARKGDLSLNIRVNHVTDSCNGESLCAVATFRATQDNCTSGNACTTEDQEDFPLGLSCCTVEKNKCRIKTTVNQALAGAINPANTPSYTINGVGLARVGGGVALRGGLMVLP